eukprot:CAMPEP_0197541484 /NCGR_PEP_ID=MMETSP1318-20131121/67179_1 /TAXON_ID=552666 /ORGANISM="Partenskyella glossopodia, Strain RCC365" /LENGTH=393 /DNA_ID=CAMNT_0043100661 /DNA_START=380 /DNA_END=1562 /DNA_ORIENTATION=+
MFSLTELVLSAIQAAIVTVCIPILFTVPSKSKRAGAGKEDLLVVGANGSGKSTFIDNHRENVVSLKEVPAADPSRNPSRHRHRLHPESIHRAFEKQRAGKNLSNADSDVRSIFRNFLVVGANGSGKSTFIGNHRGNVVSLKEVPAADPSQISAADCQCADAAIVLCDVNIPGSIEAAAEWRKALSATMPMLLVGNKLDLITDSHDGFQAGGDLELVSRRAQFCSWLIADSTDQGCVKEAVLVDTLMKETYFKREQASVLCDVNVPGSIKAAAAEWRRALSATMPTLLIGNKWDLITDSHDGFQAGADLELVASRAQFCSWLIADSTDQGCVKEAVDTLMKETYFKREQAVPVAECSPQKTPENSTKYNRRRRLRSSLSLELTSSGSIDLVGEV